VVLVEGALDAQLRLLGSGGGPKLKLGANDSIDIFVIDDGAPMSGYPRPMLTTALRIDGGRRGFVHVAWEAVDGQAAPGEICILWSANARSAGARPRLLRGAEVGAVMEYAYGRADQRLASVVEPGQPVGAMSRRMVRTRRRSQERIQPVPEESDVLLRVASVAIEGFRGFREEARLELAQPTGDAGSGLTLVVGANNTGKSTVWESFDAVARRLKDDLSFSENRRNRRSSLGIRIRLELADGRCYETASQNRDTSETEGVWLYGAEPAALELVSVPSRRQFQPRFSKNWNVERDWMINGQEFVRHRRTDDAFTGRLFDLHNNPAKKAEFDKLMAEVIGQPFRWSIDLGEESYYLKVVTGDDLSHSSEGLGDGIISLLYVLNALFDSTPQTLLTLDEPELSLHPQLARRLGQVIARFASNRQIVVFTHSPHLLSWDDVSLGATIARTFKVAGDSRIAQAPREVLDALSKARGGWKNPHVLGIDATSALFLDDEVIVVEGQEDAGLLATVFEQAQVSPRGTVFGWGAGGGDGNPRRIVALLHGLGYTKVVTLLDADKANEAAAIQQLFPHYFATTIPANDIRDKEVDGAIVKSGLLTADGKHLKAEYRESTRDVLNGVVNYFASGGESESQA